MTEDLQRHRKLRAHQEGRPIDRVEPDNVLADQVQVCRPILGVVTAFVGKADPGQVIGQRIDPHVHDVVIAARNLDPPVKAGARHGKIAQPCFYEGDHLVAAAFRAQETGSFQEGQQLVLIGGETKEPAFLNGPFDRCALGRELLAALALGQLALVVIGFVADRVPAFVAIEIEVAIRFHAPPQFLGRGMVARFRGAQEYVIGHIQSVAHINEML